jgi:phage major head subunit gpT-like protein
MPNPFLSSNFMQIMDRHLTDVAEDVFGELDPMIGVLYDRRSTDSAWEEYLEIGSIGDVPEFNGKVEYLSAMPGYTTKIEPKEYSAGLIFERKFLDDKKWNVLDGRAEMLVRSANRRMEKLAVGTFTGAFSSAFDFMTSEEGVALCSDSHTTKASGVSTTNGFDNAGTSAFDRDAMAATRLAMRRFCGENGERIPINPDTIICPDYLYDSVCEVTQSDKDPETGNNTKNMQYGRFKVIPYMRLDDSDTNNWYMVDSKLMKKFLIWFDRIKPQTNSVVDFETWSWKYSVYFRIACGFLNWRWIYGHQVS